MGDAESREDQQAVVRDLCKLASWCDALGENQKRDAALDLAEDLLDAELY